jgi:uncharacterized repeat protein (TIGR01451 family)
VVITDVLPAHLEDPLFTSSGALSSLRPGSQLIWDVADLPPGEGGAITITARADPSFSGYLANTALITSLEMDAHSENNRSGPVYTAVGLPDLGISKRGPAEVMAGDWITYTLVFSNTGIAPAHGVVITDLLPAHLEDPLFTSSGAFVSLRPGSQLIWDVSDLSPGEGGAITITARVALSFTGYLTNAALITALEVDAHAENNLSGAVHTAVVLPDLGIAKRGPAEVTVGDWVTYSLVFSNTGNASAHGVVIQDLLPAALTNATFASSGATITPRPGDPFTWDVADLSPGEGGAITITARPDPSFSGYLANTALITALEIEAHTENNRSGPVYTTVGLPDLGISKRGSAEIMAGGWIVYSLVFSNAGITPAHGVVIQDLLPAALINATFASFGAIISPRSGAPFTWDVADLSPGEGGVITIVARADPSFSGYLANTALITSLEMDAHSENNLSGPVYTAVGMPDLGIAKRGPIEATTGDWIVYTLVFSNVGIAPAHEVVIQDLLPATLINATFTYSGPTTITLRSGEPFTWDVEDLEAGQTGVITVTARLEPVFSGTLTNTATIQSPVPEWSLVNNSSEIITQVIRQPEKLLIYYFPLAFKTNMIYMPLVMK